MKTIFRKIKRRIVDGWCTSCNVACKEDKNRVYICPICGDFE